MNYFQRLLLHFTQNKLSVDCNHRELSCHLPLTTDKGLPGRSVPPSHRRKTVKLKMLSSKNYHCYPKRHQQESALKVNTLLIVAHSGLYVKFDYKVHLLQNTSRHTVLNYLHCFYPLKSLPSSNTWRLLLFKINLCSQVYLTHYLLSSIVANLYPLYVATFCKYVMW